MLQNRIKESYYRVILWNHIMELSLWKGSPRSQGSPQGPLGLPEHASESAPGRTWTPTDHKNNCISTNWQRQTHSIAASESFSCNAWFRRPAWSLYHVHFEKGALFGKPQGPPGGAPSSQEGMDAHGRIEDPIRPMGQAPLHILDIYIRVYIFLMHMLGCSRKVPKK